MDVCVTVGGACAPNPLMHPSLHISRQFVLIMKVK